MSKRSDNDDKVIHVVFGPGGGRVSEPRTPKPSADAVASRGSQGSGDVRIEATARRSPTLSPELPSEPQRATPEPVSDVYSLGEVAKLLGLSEARLRTLDKSGVASPTGRRRGRRAYTFQDLIALRVARELLAKRVKLREVARAVESIRASLPKVTRPLAELSIASDGKQVVVRTQSGDFVPASGQLLLDFEVRALRDDVVRVLRPNAGKERTRTAYDLYIKASQLDENPDTVGEAERLYRRAVELDPWLAIAYTNLGNICFRRGEEAEALGLYRRALQVDPAQPEAQYNLGYVVLEHGKPEQAIRYFRGAIGSDPRFADAYFNLAMAYEQSGDAASARPYWQKYLELEPTGTWAEIARKHL
jgi:tetratricopeptide (TPR) repeat protein